MENIIAGLVQDFEAGKLSRRQLIRNLAITIGTASSLGTAGAYAAEPGLKTVGIKHISYQVADYKKTRDFYSQVLGMKILGDTGERCNLVVGDLDLIPRNGSATTLSTKPGPTPFVDHIAYSIDKWNKDEVFALLKRRGLNPQLEGNTDIRIEDPDGMHVQLRNSRMSPSDSARQPKPKTR